MGRPVTKIKKEGIKFMIENSGEMSFSEMARHLGVHHTTILHWVKRLASKGVEVKFGPSQSEADRLIDEVKKELNL